MVVEASAKNDVPPPQPLRSKHTANFPALLGRLGISLLVSTYQAGKLVLLRAEGDRVNTHFRDLPRPMGLAAGRDSLAVGTAQGDQAISQCARGLPAFDAARPARRLLSVPLGPRYRRY